ncbi:IS3 family transposase [Leuconostoc gelidum]
MNIVHQMQYKMAQSFKKTVNEFVMYYNNRRLKKRQWFVACQVSATHY